jgi:5-methylcytosine-specific restriction protein B
MHCERSTRACQIRPSAAGSGWTSWRFSWEISRTVRFSSEPRQYDTLAATKRQQLNRVLALLPDPPEVPGSLLDAFDAGGVASFATGKAWSPALLRFNLRLAIALKELDASARERVLQDPWAFRDLVAAVRTSTDQMMANAVKHLIFPETFESMIAPSHREALIRTFNTLPGVADLPNSDRKIERIAQGAAEATSGGEFNLYAESFRNVWSEPLEPRWLEAVRLAQRLFAREDFDDNERTYKLRLAELVAAARDRLLAGDSEWLSALASAFKDGQQNLVGWRVYGAFLEWAEADRERASAAVWHLWGPEEYNVQAFADALPSGTPISGKGTRASLASFLLQGVDPGYFPFYKPSVHQGFRRALGLEKAVSTSNEWVLDDEGRDLADGDETVVDLYEDWAALLEELRYRLLVAGTDLRDMVDAQGLAWWLVNAHPPTGWSEDELAALEAFKSGKLAGLVHTSPPEQRLLPEIDAEFASELHLPVAWLTNLVELLEEKRQVILYGPPGTGKTFIAQHLGELISKHGGGYRLVQFHPSYTYEDFFEGYRPTVVDGVLSFKIVPGTLREIAKEAVSNPQSPYLLIIDEINRGNLAKIFGELYFLLEYRDRGIRLQYSREEQFSLPDNLFLLGTMNTADRSIALVDSALRRRFFFEELSPTKPPVEDVLERWLEANDHDPEAAVLLRALNAEINDEDFAIGPSYFIKRDGTLPDLERVWRNQVIPLLREHFYGTEVSLDRFELSALRKSIAADAD